MMKQLRLPPDSGVHPMTNLQNVDCIIGFLATITINGIRWILIATDDSVVLLKLLDRLSTDNKKQKF